MGRLARNYGRPDLQHPDPCEVVLKVVDFMLGRMFSGPLVLAVALAGLYPALGRWWGALPVCLLLVLVACAA